MRKALGVLGFVLVALLLPSAASRAASNPKMMTEYGKSRPPIGYVLFCKRGADECKSQNGKAERVKLTDGVWNEINQVNQFVNSAIKPASDMDTYKTKEYWAYPTSVGDCEDYVLLKKKLLMQLGFRADELLITVLLDENGEGHAVLSVLASNADYILDNRRTEILSADQSTYTFLKRQSQLDPTQWMSLRKTDTQVVVSSQSK
ncbi:MAG: transglutaminase-like cysteine peptidase [Alphaproteobacteria bacterium]|nr:transglutaminase-like cysteine peptidase [Alphaproteobacteria bacterium]